MFRSRWWVVVASFLAMIAGQGCVMVFGSGVFIKPLAAELHYGRGVIASAMGLANIVVAVVNPFTGRMLDRYGFRIVLIPMLILFALTTAMLSLLSGAVFVLLMLFALQGLWGAASTPTPFAKMVTGRFDDHRGLALGITLAGIGVGIMGLPQLCGWLLRHFGWRAGYLGLGAFIIVLSVIPVAIWFGPPKGAEAAKAVPGSKPVRFKGEMGPGADFSEAVRAGKFWLITIGISLGCMAVNSSLVHVVPLLTDRGFSLAQAVDVMSGSGLALIAGRVLAGYIVDRIFASYVFAGLMACPMVGIALLAFRVGGAGPVVAVVLLGIGVGGEHDVIAYMISRYFGTRAFGATHGVGMSFTLIFSSVGTALLGFSYQLYHSYNPGFVVWEVVLAVAIASLMFLGPYRYPVVKPSQTAAAAS